MRTIFLLLFCAVIAGSSTRFRSNWFGYAGVVCALLLFYGGQL
ncbi:MAG: hypothetical protein AAF081_12525 [Actinomycetota bacterium]